MTRFNAAPAAARAKEEAREVEMGKVSGRGNAGQAPASGAGGARAGGASTGGASVGGEQAPQDPSKAITDYLMGLAKAGGYNSNADHRGLVSSAEKYLGTPTRTRQITAEGNGYLPLGHSNDTFAKLAANAVTSSHFISPEEYGQAVAKSYGATALTPELEAQVLADAKANQGFASSAYRGTGKAVAAAMSQVGPTLLGDAAVADQFWQATGLTAEKLRVKFGPAAGDGFEAEIKARINGGDIKGALDQLQITEGQLKDVIPPEVKTEEVFKAPYLKDMPLWQHAAGIAGVGAGASALAYHLLAQGQQQQSSADYNAMAQALAAY